jgi:hypothetical protein
MENFIDERVKHQVKHLWRLHFKTLGFAQALRPIWKHRYKFLFATLTYGIAVWLAIDNLVFAFLPLFFLLCIHLVIVIDLIYTSNKCVNVLNYIHTYTDNSMNMFEMFAIIKEDEELKDDIWF